MIARLQRYLKRFDIRISLIYAITAILWIGFSDFFPLLFFGNDHPIQAVLNSLIGWGFVVVTTVGLFLLLSAELRKRTRVEKELQLEREISPIAIAVFGIDGRITFANAQAEKALGKPRTEIIGKLFDDASFQVTDHYGHPTSALTVIAQLVQTKQPVYGIEHAVLDARGNRILLDVNLSPLLNEHNEITAVVATFNDVTKSKTHEKQLRESEERFRLLFNNNPLPVAVYDPDTLSFIEVNDATVEHYGYTREEFLSMVIPDLRIPDDTPEIIEDTQKIFQNLQRTERRHKLKNGQIIYVLVTSQIIEYRGRKAVMAVAQDITRRKQAEKVLRESEYSLKQAQAIAHVGDWSWDKQTNTIRWSDEMYTIFGIDQSNFRGNPAEIIPMVIHPDDRQYGIEINQKLLNGTAPDSYEYRIIWPDGSTRYLITEAGETLYDSEGKVLRLSGIVQDITERKQAEKAIRDSEASMKRAQAVAHVGDWAWNIETNAIHASDEIYKILGLDKATFRGDLSYIVEHVIHPEDEILLVNALEASVRGQKTENFECRVVWPDGTVRHIWAQVGEETTREDGVVIAMSGIIQDITERKQFDRALRESEASLRLAQSVAHLGSWVIDIQAGTVIASDEAYRIFGFDRGTMSNKITDVIAAALHPEDQRLIIQAIREILSGETLSVTECRIIHPDGSIRHIWIQLGDIQHDSNGTITTLNGIVQDITERIEAEQALRESESSLKLAQAVAHVGSWTLNLQNNVARASDEAYQIFGIDRKNRAENFHEILISRIHPDDQQVVLEAVTGIIAGFKPSISECRIIRTDGETRHIWVELGELHRDAENNALELTGIIQDITERKLAEEALRESEASLKLAQNVAHVGNWTLNLRTNTARASDEAYRIFAIDPSSVKELFNNLLISRIHPDDQHIFAEAVAEIIAGNTPLIPECRIVRTDGELRYIWIELGELRRDSDGNPFEVTGILQDITERKQAEKAIRDSEASLKRAQSIAHLGDWSWNNELRTMHWSDEMYTIFGIDRANFDGDKNNVMIKAIHPDDKALGIEINHAIMQGSTGTWELRIIHPDGSLHYLQIESGGSTRDNSNAVQYVAGIIQDITERKQAEQALRDSELRYRTLINQASDGIYLASADGRFLDINISGCLMSGYTRDELLQKSIPDVVKFTPERPLRFDEVRQGKIVVNQFELIRRDGSLLDVEISSKQLSDGNLQGIVRDITERKQAEQALRDSEIRYRTLIDQASEAILVTEINGYYTEANVAACTMLGYTRDEILQKKMLDLFVIEPENPLRETELMQGKTLLIERQMIRKDGSLVSVEVSSKLLTDSTVQAIARDITERKAAEQELRLKSTALDSAGNGIAITDINGTIEWVNPAFTRLTGYSVDEVIGHNPRDLVRSGLHNRLFYEELWSTILAGYVWQGELVNRRKDGSLYTEEQTITPVRNESGQITHFVAIQQDVTARKLAEAAVHRLNVELEERVIERTTQLNNIKTRIESILNSNADAIVYSNINGIIEQINPAFTQTFGYLPNEIAGQPFHLLVAEKERNQFDEAFITVTSQQQTQQIDVSAHHKDGSTFDAAIMLSPVIQQGDHMIGVVLSIHDVTSRNLMLHHAMDLNELKSRYVAMAAHDLRNPMAVILSSTSGLEAYYDKLTPDRRQAKFDQIKSNIKVMTDILNDILVMGQVESGKMEFRPAPVDVVALCQTLITEAVEGSGTNTRVDFVTQDLNNALLMDAKLLRHILSNLLSNAIKYSPTGSFVEFHVRRTNGQVEFYIRDHGIGIPQDDQARLFETFFRATNAKQIRGTGLGLAIVKQSVELHGGTISFESAEGQGTSFTISLPASTS